MFKFLRFIIGFIFVSINRFSEYILQLLETKGDSDYDR